MKFYSRQSSFTLIELLIVIAIIAIIAGAILVAINPAKRMAQAQDSRRWSEVESIATAISAYVVDNGGQVPNCANISQQIPADGIWRWIGTNGNVGSNFTADSSCQAAWLFDDNNFGQSVFVQNTSFQDFSFNADLKSGVNYKLAVSFTNDQCCGGSVCACGSGCPVDCTTCPPCCAPGCEEHIYDRNLFVDYITFSPVPLPPTANPIQAETFDANNITFRNSGGQVTCSGTCYDYYANGDFGRSPINFSDGIYNIIVNAKGLLVNNVGSKMNILVSQGVIDSSGKSNLGSEINAPSYSSGINKQGIIFDGNNYIEVPFNSSLDITGDMTIMAWVYPTSIGAGWQNIVARGATYGYSYQFSLVDNSKFGFDYYSPQIAPPPEKWNSFLSNSGEVSINKWVHLAVVKNSSTNKVILFKNGKEIASAPRPNFLPTSNSSLGIGASGSGGEKMKGGIDEVAIFNRVLSQEEIKEIYLYSLSGQREYCDLSSELNSYLYLIPHDPSESHDSISGYLIKRDPSGVVSVKAPHASQYATQEIVISK